MKKFKLIHKIIATFLVMLMVISGFVFPMNADASGGREIDVTGFPGGRGYQLFVPSGYTPGEELPLIVMLHGCQQTPMFGGLPSNVNFRNATQMNQIAERENFMVMYPNQPSANNANGCWNWFEPANHNRAGEAQIIVDMVRRAQRDFTVNDDAVFVAGLSAGGAKAVNLGVLYPDVFSGVASVGGLAYQSGTTMMNALQAMSPGSTAVNPVTAARNASNRVPANARNVVPTLMLHGNSDTVVVPRASEHIETQMLEYNRLHGAVIGNTPENRSGTANGLNYTVRTFRDADGDKMTEFYRITGLDHAWSGGHGGTGRPHWADSRGPNASSVIWEFFRETIDSDDSNIYPTQPTTAPPTQPTTAPPTQPTTAPPTQPTTAPPTQPTTAPPTQPTTAPEFIYVRANVNQHNMAGRVPASLFFHYFSLHGPTGQFNMYQVVGTNTWTSTRPGS